MAADAPLTRQARAAGARSGYRRPAAPPAAAVEIDAHATIRIVHVVVPRGSLRIAADRIAASPSRTRGFVENNPSPATQGRLPPGNFA
ncbi:hypothetical protein WL36_16720 [Burkholderia ubonensis]|nr:hypothetical protein WJ82_21635 [Burkholderia ubonensis]KWB44727.1 hypothetical protein WL36_16720 [Burkholderia ubonensis]